METLFAFILVCSLQATLAMMMCLQASYPSCACLFYTFLDCLVWSPRLRATAEVFASLKANRDEPDESKAMRVSVPTEEGVVENDVRAENYDTSAVECLRRLPVVTDANYRALVDGCKSLAEFTLLPVERLAEVALLPVERLAGLMGSQKTAETLRDFLDVKCPTML